MITDKAYLCIDWIETNFRFKQKLHNCTFKSKVMKVLPYVIFFNINQSLLV